MKKILILVSLCLTLPGLAMCSIEDDAVTCTAQGFREEMSPTYNPQSNINTTMPETRLNPIKRDNTDNQPRSFAPNESNFNYNSSCQFGVCLKNRNTPLFQQSQ